MADIDLETWLFPTQPEGDLAYCNGCPGSKLSAWIREVLLHAGMRCDGPFQEDWGWGVWVWEDDCRILVGVGWMGARAENAQPAWKVHISHDPGLSIGQQLRGKQATPLVARIQALLEAAVASDTRIRLLPPGTL
ncbi:MAG TPA: hypothetical protein VGO93_08995 [Candidatus Xenobia bacterium]